MRPADTLRLQIFVAHHLVDQTHAFGLLGRILTAHEPDLAGLLLSHDAGQIGAAEAGVEAPHLGARLAEAGVDGGDGEVAHHMQHVAAADGPAVDHRHDGFGQTAYLHLHVEHREAGRALLVDVAAATLHVHVAARAEGLLAQPFLAAFALKMRRLGPREQHHTDAGEFAHDGERLGEFTRGGGGEGVAHLGAVDGDLGDAFRLLQADLAKGLNAFPFHKSMYVAV